MPEKIELRKLVMCFTTSFKILLSCKWSCFISRINLFEDYESNFFCFVARGPDLFVDGCFLTASPMSHSFWFCRNLSALISSQFQWREGKPFRDWYNNTFPYRKMESSEDAGWSCNHPDYACTLQNAYINFSFYFSNCYSSNPPKPGTRLPQNVNSGS